MVGLVVVSHSEALAEGVVALAREMGGEELALEAAGGLDEPGALGTDPDRVRAAIERAMSDDGVLVLMDLGSALMSAEMAIELLADGSDRVRMTEAPLVEGAVAAAVAARGGASLEDVADEARGALAMKAAQLGADAPAAAPAAQDAPAADARRTGRAPTSPRRPRRSRQHRRRCRRRAPASACTGSPLPPASRSAPPGRFAPPTGRRPIARPRTPPRSARGSTRAARRRAPP